ncbi:hypothetical protein FACS189487_06640 [Campylobacterota bacterium]|nr:hypothetical protein FACS189487_06640 [Campylobacterota bacterium]
MKAVLLAAALCAAILTNAVALSLDEAIDLALINRARVIGSSAALRAANERENSAIASFLPTIGASQTINDRDTKTAASAETTRIFAQINLFNGFGDYALLRSANWAKSARAYELDAVKADVILAAKEAFFGCLKARDTLLAANENLRAMQRQFSDAEAFYALGLIASYERHQIAIETLQSEQTALKAKSDLAIALKTLEYAIAAPITSDLETPKERYLGSLGSVDRAVLSESMLKNRSEIKSLSAQIEAQKNQKTKALSPAFPSIDAQIAKEKYRYDTGFSGQNEQTTATLTLSWQLQGLAKPYFDREAAFYDQKILESQLIDLRQTLELQLSGAFERLALADRALKIAEESLKLAQENLQIAQNRFNEQIATSSELIDADAALWRAREQRTFFYYDRLLAIAQLERVVETTLYAQ